MSNPQTTKAKAEALRKKIKLARAIGRIEGINAAARRVEGADNTMMKQKKLAAYIRDLNAENIKDFEL